jgi:DNA-binding NtrC family response regulator
MKLNVKAGRRLLLVENEAPLRRSLENYLKIGGYTFRSCSTARDALVLAEVLRPDVMIVEYRLPDASGLNVVGSVRRICPHVVVAVISEYDFQWIAKELNQANVHCFLKKPFDPVELETVLSSSCSKARAVMSGIQVDLQVEKTANFPGSPPPSWDEFSNLIHAESLAPLKVKIPLNQK